ncbi:hypothetical protein HPB52_000842 [Rhipicephalus sanguineus]|uniref:Uncharacterized protein n=1 Tax=Rhipicephalus sanguineus TaxID=34632 RepID=A0A9D4PEY6_RHISA|nr:hypothetical protein HPB52_000842 [Rhipicephalus sanguineus]
MNSRETSRYSNHTTLSKDDPEYWKFSFDEIGRYDVAAGVDHVLNVTGADRLTLASLSQGVTAILVFLSTRPEYNDKVDLVVGYGPVANVSHLEPPLSLLIPFTPLLAMYRAKDFVMYDHGAKENRKRYGQAEAPAYPLERITTPWAIFSSEGDHVADPRDVADLVARLGPRVILHRVVPQKTLRHVDFSIGYRTTDFLHNVAIDVIKQQTDESA